MVVEVVDDGRQTDVENGQVCLMLQSADNLFKMEVAGTFYEDGLVREIQVSQSVHQHRGVRVASYVFKVEAVLVFAEIMSYGHKVAYVVLVEQGVEFFEILRREFADLFEIGDDEGFVAQLRLRVHKVEGGPQGVDVQAVGVVDDYRVVDHVVTIEK